VDEIWGDLRVGTDLVPVAEVAETVARFGPRYVGRIYTDHEVSCCQGTPSVVAAGLAARFAAKEATIKVLRPVDAQPDWRSIEIRRDRAGWCAVHLTGTAARLAQDQGISHWAVSMTHEAGLAAAVVVAVCDETTHKSARKSATRESATYKSATARSRRSGDDGG
jgi:holo-[acyl-carrier protein] synthase